MPFAKWFIRTKFDNVGKIAKITVPKLIVHSRDDEMIPFWMAEKLHESAAEPKQLAAFDGAGHNDLIYRHRSAVLDAFRSFLSR